MIDYSHSIDENDNCGGLIESTMVYDRAQQCNVMYCSLGSDQSQEGHHDCHHDPRRAMDVEWGP